MKALLIVPVLAAILGLAACSKSAPDNMAATDNLTNVADPSESLNGADIALNETETGGDENMGNGL